MSTRFPPLATCGHRGGVCDDRPRPDLVRYFFWYLARLTEVIIMNLSFDLSALSRSIWHEYAVRLGFGGAVAVLAGLLAKHCGPAIAGQFLAFPAIFASSATLVDKHERQKKRSAGIRHTIRGSRAAGLDAAGATMGSIGLACFGFVAWNILPDENAAAAVAIASIVWL
jgi:hypothetical protein